MCGRTQPEEIKWEDRQKFCVMAGAGGRLSHPAAVKQNDGGRGVNCQGETERRMRREASTEARSKIGSSKVGEQRRHK